jgi:hypothetical protein
MSAFERRYREEAARSDALAAEAMNARIVNAKRNQGAPWLT